jgi:hypothetical protein
MAEFRVTLNGADDPIVIVSDMLTFEDGAVVFANGGEDRREFVWAFAPGEWREISQIRPVAEEEDASHDDIPF